MGRECMSRGLSLHIGLNRVNPEHYAGWDGGPLHGCEHDANDMEQLAQSRGFEARKLLTKRATADAVISAIRDAAQQLKPGDIFFLSYSGHGGQVVDLHGEEQDRADETWLAYDRQIIDDELAVHWGSFQPGVRIIVLSDCCHGGAVTSGIVQGPDDHAPSPVATGAAAAERSPLYRNMPMDVMFATYRMNRELYDEIQTRVPGAGETEIAATVLGFLGCQDQQLARDGFGNGLFTESVLAVWDGGAWKGDHVAFYTAIRSRMPDRQQPNYRRMGAENDDFERQNPFTVG
jgi:hypothetical protein